jgi:DUF1680 family protein
VYCLEQHDQAEDVVLEDLAIDPSAPVEILPAPNIPGVRTMLEASGEVRRPASNALYTDAARGGSPAGRPVSLTAIPYFRWANRGPSAMRVWIPTI